MNKKNITDALKETYDSFCDSYQKLDEKIDKNFNSFKEKYGTKIDSSNFKNSFEASDVMETFRNIKTDYKSLSIKIKNEERKRDLFFNNLSQDYGRVCSLVSPYEESEPEFSNDLNDFYEPYCDKGVVKLNHNIKYNNEKYGKIKSVLTTKDISEASPKLEVIKEKFDKRKVEIDKKREEERINQKEIEDKKLEEQEMKKKEEEEKRNAELEARRLLKEKRMNLENKYKSKRSECEYALSKFFDPNKFQEIIGIKISSAPFTTDLESCSDTVLEQWCNAFDNFIREAKNYLNEAKKFNDQVVAFLNELSTKISRDNRLKPFLLNYGYKHNDIDIYKNVWMIYDEMYTDFIDVHYFGKHIEEKKGHDKYVALDNKFRKERRNSFLLVEYNSGDGNFETKCRNVTGFYTRDGWSNTFEFLDKLYKQLYTYNGYYGCFTSEINQICNFLKTINNLPCRI